MKIFTYIEESVRSCEYCNDARKQRMMESRNAGKPVKFAVECLSCGARGPKAESYDRALLLYNQRGKNK